MFNCCIDNIVFNITRIEVISIFLYSNLRIYCNIIAIPRISFVISFKNKFIQKCFQCCYPCGFLSSCSYTLPLYKLGIYFNLQLYLVRSRRLLGVLLLSCSTPMLCKACIFNKYSNAILSVLSKFSRWTSLIFPFFIIIFLL